MPLSQAKIQMVAGIFAVAPDSAMHRLESLLMQASAADASLEPVHTLAAAENEARRIVATVFAPLLPMTVPATAPKRQTLKFARLISVWRDLVKDDSDLAERTGWAVRGYRSEDPAPIEFDNLCLHAAVVVRESDPDLARLFALCRVLRTIQNKLPAWTHNLSSEHIAGVRLAFKDALTVDEDAAPAVWEAVFAMLPQPWQVIRLISAAIDRPSDRYLAASELADLGRRLLDDIDDRIGSLKRFDPSRGEESGAAEAASVMIAVQEMVEFEEWLALAKDGPWGQRIVEQKRNLALCMEARLREAEPAVATALQAGRGGAKSRAFPKLTDDPQPIHVTRAEALLTLIEEARGAAAIGGFGAARSKTLEALESRLDQYCEDVLELLHKGGEVDPDRCRAFLEIAARFVGLVKGPQGAAIVRRRAAAA
jgi:hypothetical protein